MFIIFNTNLYVILKLTIGVRIYCDHTRNQSHSMDEIGAMAPIRDMGSNNYGQTAKVIREKIKNYFMNEGELSFQYDKI